MTTRDACVCTAEAQIQHDRSMRASVAPTKDHPYDTPPYPKPLLTYLAIPSFGNFTNSRSNVAVWFRPHGRATMADCKTLAFALITDHKCHWPSKVPPNRFPPATLAKRTHSTKDRTPRTRDLLGLLFLIRKQSMWEIQILVDNRCFLRKATDNRRDFQKTRVLSFVPLGFSPSARS